MWVYVTGAAAPVFYYPIYDPGNLSYYHSFLYYDCGKPGVVSKGVPNMKQLIFTCKKRNSFCGICHENMPVRVYMPLRTEKRKTKRTGVL